MSKSSEYSIDPGWRVLWRDLGVSWTDVLKAAALPEDLLARESQTLSAVEYFALFRALESAAKDPLLPVKIVERYAVESFQPPLFAALCSPNLGVACERLAQYKRLIGPMKLTVRAEDALRIELRWTSVIERPPAGLVLTELAFLVRLARIATREPVRATAVTLADADAPIAPGLSEFFGAEVRRGERHSVTFSREDAALPFLTANAGMWAVFEPELRRRLMDLDGAATLRERVRAALLELLPSGRTSLGDAAQRLAMSARTLQRRLGEDGTSFQAVLDETRRELALHYLQRTAITSGEISFLLGFADPSSFFRAFHGWTGLTPERARGTSADRS